MKVLGSISSTKGERKKNEKRICCHVYCYFYTPTTDHRAVCTFRPLCVPHSNCLLPVLSQLISVHDVNGIFVRDTFPKLPTSSPILPRTFILRLLFVCFILGTKPRSSCMLSLCYTTGLLPLLLCGFCF